MHAARFNVFYFSSGSSDEVFSLALYHFNHTLVTSDLPSPALQVRGISYQHQTSLTCNNEPIFMNCLYSVTNL